MVTERLLVTGSSGFIGTNVVEAMRDRYPLLALDRRVPRDPSHLRFWKRTDLLDERALRKVVTAFCPTLVVHLAADTGVGPGGSTIFPTNTTGVSNLISALRAAGTVRRCLFTSTKLVCRNGYSPSGEDDYCPDTPYGESKVAGEKLVKNAELPFEWVITRPAGIWGPWFAEPYRPFFERLRDRRYVHSRIFDTPKLFGYVGNSVAQMAALLNAEAAVVNRRTFYIADYEPQTIGRWAALIAGTFGVPAPWSVPAPVVRVAARLGDIARHFGVEAPLTTFRLNNMITDTGTLPIAATRGIIPDLPYDVAVGVAQTVSWLRRIDKATIVLSAHNVTSIEG